MGCTLIQKMTGAIHILAYGISTDLCDEYIKVGERTAIESLKRFCDAVIALYSPYTRQTKATLHVYFKKGKKEDSQITWVITHGPVYYWKKEDLSKIMRTCIILHNMIIEDEGDTNILEWTPPTDESVYNRDRSFLAAHISTRLSRIRNVENNGDLRRDLMEHL
ncbi:uncharacterized protein LOC132301455 [Cornus florida]|uniref:uncharacterized protein LOC132301455 n=1 Tax=Cornus florida TaxID=4283 RepID=UPI0028A2128E|nr:uncharacterized protein LOC132301455 [Cornus florida]